jgi:predicted CXXCH cytochrome family protein
MASTRAYTRIVSNLDARYALWGAAILLLTTLPAFAGFVGAGWEFSQMAGLLGCIGCVALCGAPLRPRDASPPTLVSLPLHTLIGCLALLAVLIHVGGLILADRLVVEYLKLSAPLYQLAGIVAAALLLIIVLSSIASVRRRLWRSHRGFQSTHVILGIVLIALIAAHVIATDRYVGGRGRRALVLAAMIGGILLLLRPRRPSAGLPVSGGTPRQLVFGRNSTLVLGVATILALSLAGLMTGAAGAALREPLLHGTNSPPLDFPHAKHVAVNCLTCHHNFADGRGLDPCVECHRSNRTDLKEGLQARFHAFCFECHRHPDASLAQHGPVSGCSNCHHPPSGPR